MKSQGSFLLKATTPAIFLVVFILALHLLLRGHNHPGGGFVGGLALAMALLLHGLAHGFDRVEAQMRLDPILWASFGLAVALGTAAGPVFFGRPFFEHHQTYLDIPFFGKTGVGTPLLFDIGVMLVVVGISAKIIFIMARSTSGRCALLDEEVSQYASPAESPIESGKDEDAG